MSSSEAEPEAVVRELLAAFSAADFERMKAVLAPDLLAYVTNQAGGADEIRASKGERRLHNFAAHLMRVAGGAITEWRMVEAKPAESDAFWS